MHYTCILHYYTCDAFSNQVRHEVRTPQGPWKSILSDKKKKKLDRKLKMTILLSLDFERNTRFESDDMTNVTQIMCIYIYI